jgi:hypothetical protein
VKDEPKNYKSGANEADPDRILPNGGEVDGVHFDEIEEEKGDWREENIDALAEALREILTWLVAGRRGDKDWAKSVFRKTIAMVWAMRPDLLDNKSLRSLSKERGIGTRTVTLSYHVSAFTKKFGFFHRGTRSPTARKKDSVARKKYLKKKKDELRGDSETPKRRKGN